MCHKGRIKWLLLFDFDRVWQWMFLLSFVFSLPTLKHFPAAISKLKPTVGVKCSDNLCFIAHLVYPPLEAVVSFYACARGSFTEETVVCKYLLFLSAIDVDQHAKADGRTKKKKSVFRKGQADVESSEFSSWEVFVWLSKKIRQWWLICLWTHMIHDRQDKTLSLKCPVTRSHLATMSTNKSLMNKAIRLRSLTLTTLDLMLTSLVRVSMFAF